MISKPRQKSFMRMRGPCVLPRLQDLSAASRGALLAKGSEKIEFQGASKASLTCFKVC